MCKNQTKDSGSPLSAQGWLNEAQKSLRRPRDTVDGQLMDMRKSVEEIINACRQFKEKQKEGYYAGRERRSSTFEAGPLNRGRRASDKLDEKTRVVFDDIAKEINEAALKDVGVIEGVYPGVQPFQLLLDTTAKLGKALETEKERVESLTSQVMKLLGEEPEDAEYERGDEKVPASEVRKERRHNLIGRRVLGTRRKSDMRYMPPLLDMHAGEEEPPSKLEQGPDETKLEYRQRMDLRAEKTLKAMFEIDEKDSLSGRSLAVRCKTCMSYKGVTVDLDGVGIGMCRQRAPGCSGASEDAVWPLVGALEWCGQHGREEAAPAHKDVEKTVVSRCLAIACRNYNGSKGCMLKEIKMGHTGDCCNIDSLALRKSGK